MISFGPRTTANSGGLPAGTFIALLLLPRVQARSTLHRESARPSHVEERDLRQSFVTFFRLQATLSSAARRKDSTSEDENYPLFPPGKVHFAPHFLRHASNFRI